MRDLNTSKTVASESNRMTKKQKKVSQKRAPILPIIALLLFLVYKVGIITFLFG